MATRFYLPSSGTAPAAPAYSGVWEETAGGFRAPLVATPSNSPQVANKFVDKAIATSPADGLAGQWISDPLPAGSIAGTFALVIGGGESTSSRNAFLQAVVRVVSGDGSTVRGTLYAGQAATVASATATDPAYEFALFSPTVRILSATLSSVTALAGDRLVVEVGARAVNANTYNNSVTLSIGDSTSATDLPATVDAAVNASNQRPWIEFSQDIFSAGPSAASVALSGTLAPKVGAFGASAVVPAEVATIALTGTLSRKMGTFSHNSVVSDAATATLAAALPAKVATFTSTAVVPVTPAPSAVALSGHAVVVAQAFGPVTMQGTQPVYSISQAATPRARQRIVVDGVDVTYFRGGILPDATYTLVSPLLYGPGTLEVPQVAACFERLGEGELSWLREGASVVVERVIDDVVVGTDYRGVIVAFDLSGRTLSVELGGEASGRAALRNRQVPIFPRRNDIGHQIDDAVRDLGLPTTPHLGPVTGIETMTTGGTGHLEHIQNLVAKAFTKAGRQWTIMPDEHGIYRTFIKDIDTIHGTVFTDDTRTVANLRRDISEEPNRIFGTGVTPAGMRVRNGVYPGLIQGMAPAFPGLMQDGDTGEDVQVLINRLQAVGYIGLRDVEGGYDDDVHDAVLELQTDAGLFDDGFGTTPPGWVDEPTWRALFDLDVTGGSLGGAHIEPMAQRRKVRKWRRSGSGVPVAINPFWEPEALVVDRNIDFGAGLKRRQMFNRSKAELHDSNDPNWVGDITFNTGALIRGEKAIGATLTEADVMDARELQPGMNLWLPQFDGGTLVHVSACQVDGEGTVTATVDTRFRDAMEVWEVIARNRESRRDPARNRDRAHRSSTIVKDSIGEIDEIGGLVGHDVPLQAGWNIIEVVGAYEGTMSRIRTIVQTVTNNNGVISVEPHEHVVAVFGKNPGVGTLNNMIPRPLTVEGTKVWEKRADEFESQHWLLYSAGSHEEPCGYSPGRKHWKSVTTEEPNPDYDPATDPDSAKVISVTTEESWGVLTGKHVDDAGFAYRAEDRCFLYLAVWVAKPTTLHKGRVMWPQLEAGV